MSRLICAVTALMLLAAGPLAAQPVASIHGATLGIGGEAGYILPGGFAVRGGYQMLDVDFDYEPDNENGVEGDELQYDGDLELQNGHLFGDWHPFGNGFRVTAGAVLNFSDADFVTNCESNSGGLVGGGSSCEIGNSFFPSNDIGEIRTKIEFNNVVAPYIGIGWGNTRASRWAVTADLGVAYLGPADADIQSSGSCNSTPSCREQLDREEKELEEELKDLQWFPVLKLGVGYRF